jgi:pyruvate/2-oxoglutarate/acetoin dehydrogenase E1 component
MVQLVASVCDELSAEGIEVELIDPRTVSPLDTATILASVERTGRLLVVDEPPASCGFSAEVAARVADEGFDFLDAPIRRLTGAFVPTPYAPSLEAVVVPNADDCRSAIRALVAE